MCYTIFMESLDTQVCTGCGQQKSLDKYYLHKQGHRWKKCKTCVQAVASNNRKNNPEKTKAQMWKSGLRRKYGLTPEQYEAILESQGNACAICLEPFWDRKNTHVDHDHSCCPGSFTCGKCVRKILCSKCNTALGLFNDDPARILRAASYLMEDE
jgi:hypothetical protein